MFRSGLKHAGGGALLTAVQRSSRIHLLGCLLENLRETDPRRQLKSQPALEFVLLSLSSLEEDSNAVHRPGGSWESNAKVLLGLKSGFVGSFDVQAKAWTYLRSNGKSEMRGSLRYGGKCAASGRDDGVFGWHSQNKQRQGERECAFPHTQRSSYGAPERFSVGGELAVDRSIGRLWGNIHYRACVRT